MPGARACNSRVVTLLVCGRDPVGDKEMKISRKQMKFFTAAACAVPVELNSPYTHFSYVDDAGHYTGEDICGNAKVLEQLAKTGMIQCHGDEDDFSVAFADRGDFLSAWAAGARAAEKGEGIEYSAYNANGIAFVAGHQHWHESQHPNHIPYKREYNRFCHGFVCVDTGEVWDQEDYA